MLKIFLAHASEDKDAVTRLYHQLKEKGYQPWLDKEDLLLGQNWRTEIPRVIRESQIFIACLSQRSVTKYGYVQREFRMALNEYANRPPESIYLIPLRLDECDIPDLRQEECGINLRDFHGGNLYEADGFENLLKALQNSFPEEHQQLPIDASSPLPIPSPATTKPSTTHPISATELEEADKSQELGTNLEIKDNAWEEQPALTLDDASLATPKTPEIDNLALGISSKRFANLLPVDGSDSNDTTGTAIANTEKSSIANIESDHNAILAKNESTQPIKPTQKEDTRNNVGMRLRRRFEDVAPPTTLSVRTIPTAISQFTPGYLADVDKGLSALPKQYEDSRIVLLPCDPQCAYAYWNISEKHKQVLHKQGKIHLELHFHDVTDIDINTETPHRSEQHKCGRLDREFYLPVPVSDRDYVAEIGYRIGNKRWLMLARSSSVQIPPVYPSDWINDQFVTITFDTRLAGNSFGNLERPLLEKENNSLD